jgi:hypothetical protein
MKKIAVVTLFVGLVAAVIAIGPTVVAGGGGDAMNTGGKAEGVSAEATAVGDAALAHQLAAYGRRANDPVALLCAARILKTTGGQDMDEEPTVFRAEGVEGGEKESGTEPASPESLIAAAKKLAGEDEILLSLATTIEGEKSRVAVGGPKGGRFVCQPRAMVVHKVAFVGQSVARVGIKGDGDTDLDLYVFDEHGNFICRSTNSGDTEICEWVPKWTGNFRIEVRNLGTVWNKYVILTN